MATAKSGDTVRVHYTGRLDDGTVFDSSREREPLEFTVGSGQVITGFERAVEGMEIGEARETRVEADDAYGERRDDLVLDLPKEQVPEDMEIAPGMRLELRQPDGQAVPVTVAEVGDESVTLDANHPLAGQPLTFELELVEIAG
ncbi:MAG TPA: peptidylprolyl isomerase [Gammaproteobacteria bacterium]|nr:peptidylprolyl isomerase [Gammaproteobacteria bacterium]